ncbi:MAG: MbnP family protein [Cryomorphaceae bacterium]
MKKALFLLFTALNTIGFSQTNVMVTVNHQINGEPFSWSTAGTNNLSAEFNFSRLEYYLSGFKVTHDGGVVTSFDDVYALVKGDESPTINLGELDATNIEMLSFSVGVDPVVNNGDPASWYPLHPLAPQNPSMHWGWVSGYRFIAVEGEIISTSEIYSIHGLGNANYFQTDFEINAQPEGGTLNIEITANCEEILHGMGLDETIFSHGEIGWALESLVNMNERVFEVSSITLNDEEAAGPVDFNVFPNPTANGAFTLNFDDSNVQHHLVIRDIQGKIVLEQLQIASNAQVDVNALVEGLYLVSLYHDSELRGVRKLVVRKN